VIAKVTRMISRAPRYESSWYGVWNAVLNEALPASENFEVKPQSKIRPDPTSVSSSLTPEAEARTSSDSYGGMVAHGVGAELELQVPDFVVSMHGGERESLVLVVEVKPFLQAPAEHGGAERQLRNYLERACSRLRMSTAVGLLGEGHCATLYRMRRSTLTMEQYYGPVPIDSMELYLQLRALAPPPVPQPLVATWDPPQAGPSSWSYGRSGSSSQGYGQTSRLTNEYMDALLDEGRKEFGF